MNTPTVGKAPEPSLQDAVTELEEITNSLVSGVRALETRLINPGDKPEIEDTPQPVNLKARVTRVTDLLKQAGTHSVNIENYLGV